MPDSRIEEPPGMTASEFWNVLKKYGYTKLKEIPSGGKRRVILQSRDAGDFPSITHPEDLTPEQRSDSIDKFLGQHLA